MTFESSTFFIYKHFDKNKYTALHDFVFKTLRLMSLLLPF